MRKSLSQAEQQQQKKARKRTGKQKSTKDKDHKAIVKALLPSNQHNPHATSKSESKYVEEPIVTVNGEYTSKRYEKIKVIGKGTYSKVYLVKTVNSHSHYALKIIPKNKLEVLIQQKLVYEIKIQQQLSHKNIVYLDHWFEDSDHQYIFMEYCAKGNLEDRLQQFGNMPQKQIKKYVLQIVDSLMYIHQEKILHREYFLLCNFYLDEDDNVKLGDFGFACQLSNPNELKRETCGTPNYIAPEAISGFGYSYSADVWAVGVILYRLRFNCCPFEGQTVRKTLENVKLCSYKFPPSVRVSTELKDLIVKIFNLNYDDRPTLEEIKMHKFFSDFQSQSARKNAFSDKKQEKELTKEKRGFSFSRLFSSSSKQEPKTQNNSSKLKKQKEKEENKKPIRSNSCDTFKHIKETLKQNTSRPNNNTLISSYTLQTEESSGLSSFGHKTELNLTVMPSISNRQGRGNSMRDIVDSFNSTLNFNELAGSNLPKNNRSRLEQFMKGQQNLEKDALISSKTTAMITNKKPLCKVLDAPLLGVSEKPKIFEHLLMSCKKKYYLPQEYKYERDIVIVDFPQAVKLIVYPLSDCKESPNHNNVESVIIFCSNVNLAFNKNFQIYRLNGTLVGYEELPRVLKYVIDKKVLIPEVLNDEKHSNIDCFGSEQVEDYLMKLPNTVLYKKDCLIFKYGTKLRGYFVAKSSSQHLQYLGSLEQKRLNVLFSYIASKEEHRIEDGPLISKIYAGWTSSMLAAHEKERGQQKT